jgi:hypothetical protein
LRDEELRTSLERARDTDPAELRNRGSFVQYADDDDEPAAT